MRFRLGTGWRGVAFALIVAFSFAATSVLSALAYAGGTNALSVLTVRSIVACAILYIILKVNNVATVLPTGRRNGALACGILLAVYSYGLLGAIEYMPVALAVIIFYTYPILVAGVGWISGREPFRVQIAVALAVAFAGLVLALDVWGVRPHPLGVGLALMAAVGLTILLSVIEKVRGESDSRPITLHMLAVSAVIYVVGSAILGNFALPHTTSGWVGFIGTQITFTFSIVCVFIVLSMIGPLRTSLTMNIEPVMTMTLGYLILAQTLKAWQLFGFALVIGAVLAVELIKPKVAVTAAPPPT